MGKIEQEKEYDSQLLDFYKVNLRTKETLMFGFSAIAIPFLINLETASCGTFYLSVIALILFFLCLLFEILSIQPSQEAIDKRMGREAEELIALYDKKVNRLNSYSLTCFLFAIIVCIPLSIFSKLDKMERHMAESNQNHKLVEVNDSLKKGAIPPSNFKPPQPEPIQTPTTQEAPSEPVQPAEGNSRE